MAHQDRRLGYEATAVNDGLGVLESLSRATYDLVLMDVQMPELDGLEATRRLRRERPGGNSPVVVALTANARREDCEMCIEAGMDDFVAKPVRLEALVEALKRTHAC